MLENIIGWICTFMILIAYALNAFRITTVESLLYVGLNLLGALGVAYISYRYRNFQPAFLNGVWAIIALISLISFFIR